MFKYFTHAAILTIGSALPSYAQDTLPDHADNLFLRTVVHEMGHAVIREFDFPVRTSEELMADDFATVFLAMHMPDRAVTITDAFVRFEFNDNDQEGFFSEYLDGERRAGRATCLLYGMDPDQFGGIAEFMSLNDDDASNCAETAPEIARSWRRVLAPLMMPENARVTEVATGFDPDNQFASSLQASGTIADAVAMLSKFDWHSQVRLNVVQCDGSAGWARNGRRITVCDAYIQRFIDSQ